MFRQLLNSKNNISKATSLVLLLLICFGLIQLSMANNSNEAAAAAATPDVQDTDADDVEHSIHILFCAS
jgi:hypothetical protein